MADFAKPYFKQRSEHLIAGCVESFARDLGRLMMRPGVEEVHEIRISIRRLQQALALCPETRNKKAKRSLRHLMKLCGAVRDADVAKAHFQGKPFRMLRTKLAEDRLCAEAELDRFLRRHCRALHVGGKAALHFSLQRVEEQVRRLAQDLFELGSQAIARGFPRKQLHQARVAAKQLRYTVELFTDDPVCLNPLLDLQRQLGRIHDLWQFQRIASQWEHDGVSRRMERDKRQLIEEFNVFWAQRIQPNTAGLLKEWLGVIEVGSVSEGPVTTMLRNDS